jgi:Protein of unknown function (DUF2380)
MSFVAARLSIVAVLCLTLLAGPCNALEKIMVPNLELARGGNNFGDSEKLAEKEIRLPMVGERLSKLPNAWGECELLEDSLFKRQADAAHLRSCGGCVNDIAHEVGAAYVIVSEIHKALKLISGIHVYMRTDASSSPVAVTSVAIRGNPGEAWRRNMSCLHCST